MDVTQYEGEKLKDDKRGTVIAITGVSKYSTVNKE